LRYPVPPPPRLLRDYLASPLDAELAAELAVPEQVVARFGEGFRILDPADSEGYATCFTAGYGKSLMHAGPYLCSCTGVRRFAPEEIASLLHFPATFRFPKTMSLRKRWHLLGNSLSVAAVCQVLRDLPGTDLSEESTGATIRSA